MIGQEKQVYVPSFVPPQSSGEEYEKYEEYEEYTDCIVQALTEHQATLHAAYAQFIVSSAPLAEAAAQLVTALEAGHKVLVAGNGGSAAEAQHFAAELVGRFKRERDPYAVLALTTDTSILTAIANDYGYADVFARQVAAFGQDGDILFVLSTSGASENLICAAVTARRCGMSVIAVTGNCASPLEDAADITVRIPLTDTALVQELHLAVIHILCDIVESRRARRARKDMPFHDASCRIS